MEIQQAKNIIQEFLNVGIKAGLCNSLGDAATVFNAWQTIILKLSTTEKKEDETVKPIQ